MQKPSIFDHPAYSRISEARGALLRRVLPEFREKLALRTALDVGCGLGYFSVLLRENGFRVWALDGREENVEEARKRHPEIEFLAANIEDSAVRQAGSFDLVLCMGLLYHLQNPFQALRNLEAVTGRILLIESMCVPEPGPVLLLLDEGSTEDQGLRHVAFYPSEDCLIMMCHRAGFAFVYRFARLPDHEDFQPIWRGMRRRTMLAASREPLDFSSLIPVDGNLTFEDYWSTAGPRSRSPAGRLAEFLRKPGRQKIESVRFRSKKLFSKIPSLVRLPFGSRWLAWRDGVSNEVVSGDFENAESHFVQRFLQPGMTVLDIGAHHGYYTLLASRRVGPCGRVIAFEPSRRERRKLLLHLFLNRCRNVQLRSVALAEREGETEFYQVIGTQTGCNSLRPPAVHEPTKVLRVRVSRLDDFLQRERIERVEFIKMDVEGAELAVLKGAGQLLERSPRPVILAEVYDIRTEPWGYQAREIVTFLQQRGYQWFGINGHGDLTPMDAEREHFDDNFVAVPEERVGGIGHLMKADGHQPCRLSD